ncbi:hypothetical protein HDA40_004168 [Hamadaea flava]|uniref:Restriction endonuclease n=1 Tax=Hamadaea flava TaxID=1742688 RepID=A0ABV8LIR1_9ACTN|nr:hypothetical protein [Hamadaea flava]MCP2325661.1 hypothetical protein [Hamadaea flava]
MGLPSEDQIISALDQTGFLLEQRVAQVFAKKGWAPSVGWPFRDKETGKSREIDVFISNGEFVGDLNLAAFFINTHIIVECKNTQNPFVVVGSKDHGPSLAIDDFCDSEFDPLVMGFEKDPYASTPGKLRFHDIPGWPQKETARGNQLLRMHQQSGTWKADNANVHDSIQYPMAKAIQSVRDEGFDYYASDRWREDDPLSPSFAFVYPIVVTAGPVFTVLVDAQGSTVSQVPWAQVVRQLDDVNLSGTFFFEIVSFTELERYIDFRIEQFLSGLYRRLSENLRFADPDWLLANLGRPHAEAFFEHWRKVVAARRAGTIT